MQMELYSRFLYVNLMYNVFGIMNNNEQSCSIYLKLIYENTQFTNFSVYKNFQD